MLLRMPVAALLNARGQGSRKTSLKHLKRYRGGKSREVRMYSLFCKIYLFPNFFERPSVTPVINVLKYLNIPSWSMEEMLQRAI